MTLLVAAVLPALVGLGLWQLDRAAEKRHTEVKSTERLALPPQPPRLPPGDADFLRVRLKGLYRPGEYYLVDNRVRQGRLGYWVVSRFQADDGRTYLINRGWLPAPADRDELPAVPTPAGQVSRVGVVWPAYGRGG